MKWQLYDRFVVCFVPCRFYHRLWTFLVKLENTGNLLKSTLIRLLGSLSNDDGDGNDNATKQKV